MNDTRYLAILEPDDIANAEALAREAVRRFKLIRAFDQPGLVVLTGSATASLRLGATAIAVGTLFASDGSRPRMAASSDAASVLQNLVYRCWGDYVAFGIENGGASIRVLRSPSGGLPALHARLGSATLIASDFSFLTPLGVSAAIDWEFTAYHLAFVHLRAGLTGLAAIGEILPGDAAKMTRGGPSRTALWSPWSFATPSQQYADIDEAAAALRAAITTVVRALSEREGSPLLELSGGLDSSILAAALAEVGARVSALNLMTGDPEGDERRYARLTAATTGIALSEQAVAEAIDLTLPPPAANLRPGMSAMLRAVDEAFLEAARAAGSSAFISGTGGDSVFCSLSSLAPAADAWRRFGLGQIFFKAARDVAELHGTDPWRTALRAVRLARRAGSPAPWPKSGEFLAGARIPRTPPFHPWLVEPEGALAGTRLHMRSIMAALAHLDGYARHAFAPSLFPLLTQPVIETALRIPTWMWVDGGRDRAVARRAYRGTLPDAVLARRTKGAMDALCARIFAANRSRLLPFLCEGMLAQAGLLNVPAIADYLRTNGPLRDTRFFRLLPIADTERWLRSLRDGF